MALFPKLTLLLRPQLYANVTVPVCSYYQKFAQSRTKQEYRYVQKLKKSAHKDSLIVSQLPFKAAKEDVESHFSHYGSIEYIRFPYDTTGLPCKCAEVKFTDPESLKNVAFRQNICDQQVYVDIPQDWKKHSPNSRQSHDRYNEDDIE